MTQSKACTRCGETKPLEGFGQDRQKADGRASHCLPCRRLAATKWYAERGAEQRRADPEYREHHRAYMADYVKRNRPRYRAAYRLAMARNPERIRARQREVMRRRRATAKGRLESNVSKALWRVLKGQKSGPSFELLGYRVEALMAHLEAHFRPGMTWENYGRGWHVDHIVPLAAHRYASAQDPEFHRAWALSNLQPLWAIENLVKGGRMPSALAA